MKRRLCITLLPFLLWGAEVQSRAYLLDTHCARAPEACTAEKVNPVDRISLGLESSPADGYSYFTQNFAGGFALVTATAWNLASASGPAAWINVAADTAILLQTVAWNGVFTELSHFITQRPRPFVYQDPKVRGTEPAHYTSFYSGHTSFVAAAIFGLLFCLIRRGAPKWLLILSASAGQSLILSTAIFRIFAGRHFVTDVLAGALAGALVAWFIAARHLRGPKLA